MSEAEQPDGVGNPAPLCRGRSGHRSGVIVSADVGFATVEGIVHVLPDAAGIDQLVQD